MTPEQKLDELKLVLPEPIQLPPNVVLPFSFVRVHEDRAFVSGHVPLNADGSIYGVTGKVGAEVSVDEARLAAKQVGLTILSSLKRELGELDRISRWLRVFGMVNTAPGFTQTPAVINGFSDLIIEVFGQDRGQHCRSAVGMAELPFNVPVEVEAEVAITP